MVRYYGMERLAIEVGNIGHPWSLKEKNLSISI